MDTSIYNLHIDSRDRIQGTNTNFYVDLKESRQTVGKQIRISLRSIEIPVGSIYQIDSSNCKFAFGIDGVTIYFSVPSGNYTLTSLLNYIKSQMEALDGNANVYNFSIDSDTNKINLTPTIVAGTTFDLRGQFSTIMEILGMADDTILMTNLGIYTFPYQANLNYYNYLFLCCSSVFSKSSASSLIDVQKCFYKIPISGNRFSRTFIIEEDQTDNVFYISSMSTQLNFYLLNEYGRVPELDERLNWSFTLRLKEI
jgi:hypothetical protein